MYKIRGLPRAAKEGELVAIDLEMFKQDQNRLHRPTGFFACLSIYYPETHQAYLVEDVCDVCEAMERLETGQWVFHNAVYDIFHLRRYVNIPRRFVWDIMILEKELYGGYYGPRSYSLGAMCRRYLNYRLKKELTAQFGGRETLTEELREYSFQDAIATGEIARIQLHEIEESEGELRCYTLADEPAIWNVLKMKPVRIDVDRWLEMEKKFRAEAVAAEESLGFNPRSPQQTKAALEEALGVSIPNTNAKKTLIPLYDKLKHTDGKGVELLRAVLDCRMYSKAINTYGKSWVEQHVEEDGLVYPSWYVVGTLSGRMSCTRPNLQQIPSRRLPEYRDVIVPVNDEQILLASDVNQQEPRALAFFSNDAELRRIFERGDDIHQEVANVCNVERWLGKQVNLAISYGMSSYGLSRDTGLPKSRCTEIINQYFSRFPGVEEYIGTQQNKALTFGYVRSALGRKIWINEYHWHWQNVAINAPIQGTAADHTKCMMDLLAEKAKADGMEYPLSIQVHDEVVLDIPMEQVKYWKRATSECWTEAGALVIPGVPIETEVTYGRSWSKKQD